MRVISCHDGRLLTLGEAAVGPGTGRAFRTGLSGWDALAPGGGFARGAVHELLWAEADGMPFLPAALLARGALGEDAAGNALTENGPAGSGPSGSGSSGGCSRDGPGGVLVWCDPGREVYPPALAIHGVPLDRVFLLRPAGADLAWAVAECLRCPGVAAVVAAVRDLSRADARRLQLAAERGGGAGVLLRPDGRAAAVYAAATRWSVAPAPGERTLHRRTVRLLHGHGGRIGQAVTLEYCRESRLVRTTVELADRPGQTRLPARAAS